MVEAQKPAADAAKPAGSGRSVGRLLLTLALPLALAVYSVAFYRDVADLGVTSRVYPQVIIGVLAVLLVGQVWADIRQWLRSEPDEGFRGSWQRWRRTAYTVAWTVAFMWAMTRVGFFEALTVYVAVLASLLGVRRLRTVLLFTVGMVAGIYLVFAELLNAPLPPGLLVK